jgi:hypothetical protein
MLSIIAFYFKLNIISIHINKIYSENYFIFKDHTLVWAKMLWHIHPLLGNDYEANNETSVVSTLRSVNYNREIVFLARRAREQWTATDELCFLCGLCWDYITSSSWDYERVEFLVGELSLEMTVRSVRSYLYFGWMHPVTCIMCRVNSPRTDKRIHKNTGTRGPTQNITHESV